VILLKKSISILFEIAAFLPLLIVSIVARFSKKSFEIGLGPEPLINNVYHKKALGKAGFSAQTFVNQVYCITDEFDIRADLILKRPFRILRNYYLYLLAIFRYRCLYIYFNGGPLGFTYLLWRIEPLLYELANVKVVVMPYGGDVHDMSRSPNLLLKNAICLDYPKHRLRRKEIAARIDMWIKYADHIIGGCDWVDYLYHWDTLMLGHFSIDTDSWKPVKKDNRWDTLNEKYDFRILHAPNHRNIKGTKHFVDAVKELKEEGFLIDLIILERVPNDEVKKVMLMVDLVADQLIVGWYAMFALEAMAMGKPVLCYIREDLESLYIESGLISHGELPIIKCSPFTVKETLRDLIINRERLVEIGNRSREYVIRHHSLDSVGKVFQSINKSIGIVPK